MQPTPPHPVQGDRAHSGNDHTQPKPMLPHHPEQVLHWALRKETVGKGGREEMEVPVCYLQRASQWLVSVGLAGRRGEFTEQHTAAAQSGRGGSRRRKCVHRRDKRSPSVQRQGEIEKTRPGEYHIAPGIHSARARGEDVKTVGGFPGSTSPTASLPSAPPAWQAATACYPCFRVRRFTVFSRYKSRLSLQSPKCCCLGCGA